MTVEADRVIVGNWKMNGDEALVGALVEALASSAWSSRVVVCPPATLLREAHRRLSPLGVEIGGQDCHAAGAGAHTGELSAALLRDAGARHVILGHSERRRAHGETDQSVRDKAIAAAEAGLSPIVCVGDTAEDRAAGRVVEVVVGQVRALLDERLRERPWALAYEPVWAIGTGLSASVEDIAAMHAAILEALGETGWKDRPVLYGGSVTATNARAILACPGVGGLLVGGASLDPSQFAVIVEVGSDAGVSCSPTVPCGRPRTGSWLAAWS